MAIKKRLLRLSIEALIASGRLLGPSRALRLAGAVARRVSLDPRFNRDLVSANLGRLFPDRDRAWTWRVARSFAANSVRAKIFDKHFLPRLASDELDRMVDMVGLEYLRSVLDSGRGAVCVTLHFGRFWFAPVWFSGHGYNTAAFQRADGKLPFEAETLSGGSFSANDPLASVRAVKALKRGAVTFLVLDAGKIPNPVAVEFLGYPTLFSPSSIRMARAASVPVVPLLMHVHPDDPERIRIEFFDPIDVTGVAGRSATAEETIRRIVAPFEDAVRLHPEQWYGLQSAHRRLATPDGEEARAALARSTRAAR